MYKKNKKLKKKVSKVKRVHQEDRQKTDNLCLTRVSKEGNQNNTSLGDPCQKGMVLCSGKKRLSTVNPKAHATESNNMKDMERSK